MYIPDLFGAYTKGRELAIEKNWQDLKNFEAIENARNENDLGAMDVWERRQQMPGKMNMFYNNVDTSQMNTDLARASHRGLMANANMQSDAAVGHYGIYKTYEPDYLQAVGDNFIAKVGEQSNAAQALLGKNAYLVPHAYQIGQDQGYIGHQQVLANKTTAGNLVNAANQQIAISNGNAANAIAGNQLQGIQIGNAISNQPLIQANTVDALGRVVPARNATQAQIDAANTGAMTNSQIGNLISLAQQGDAGAAWQLKQAGYNIDGSLLSAQVTQDLMGAGGQIQAGPAATQTGYPQGTTPNGMPVGLFNQIRNTSGGGSTTPEPAYYTPTVNSSDAAKVGAKVLGVRSKQAALANADFAGMVQPAANAANNVGVYYANNIAPYNPLDIRYWQSLGNNLFPGGIVEKR